MGLGQGSYGRSLPRKIALGPVGAEDHGRASVAVTIAPGLVLSCVPDIKNTDGSYKIELRAADIDIRAVLNETEGPVGGNELVNWQGLKWSTAVGTVQGFEDAASVV